jgi:hypothetical protein
MRNLEPKTIVMIACLIVAVVGASTVAQSSKLKPSTQRSAPKEKHSNDEIADWIISHSTIEGVIPYEWSDGTSGVAYARTVVTKYPDACTLRIKTTYEDDAHYNDGRPWPLVTELDFKAPMAGINVDKLGWTDGGGVCHAGFPAACTVILMTSRDDKQLFYVFRSYDSGWLSGETGKPSPPLINELQKSEWFYVQDKAMANRMVSALTDLVVQCGGKPPQPSKKEIY